jgi:hypothetical protein
VYDLVIAITLVLDVFRALPPARLLAQLAFMRIAAVEFNNTLVDAFAGIGTRLSGVRERILAPPWVPVVTEP